MENFNSPKSVQYPEIAEKIIAMAKADQDIRQQEIEDLELDGGNIDKENTEKMKEIIAEIGWPTISKVGKDASFNAWLLVQHADHDVEFQKECLILMKEVGVGEVELECLAKFEDRVRVNSGSLQWYGTQFQDPKDNNGVFIPKPIENEENVEDRRKEMGLPTIAEATKEMYIKYNIPEPK